MKTPVRRSNKNETFMTKATRLIPILLATSWLGCAASTGGSSAATTSSLTVSGSMSLSSSAQSMSVGGMSEESVSALDVNLALYTVTCATATTPILYGSSAVTAGGAFSVSIIGGTGQPMSCYLSIGGVRAADFIITDASKTDLNGASQVSGTATFTSNANMGAITFDPNSGEVTVPSTNIAGSLDTAAVSGTVFDSSGTWTIGAVDFVLPSGVKGPVAASCATGGGEGCNGPPSGQAIYMKLWKGLKTSDLSDTYGLQLWNSTAAATSCGNKIGLTTAIKTASGLDFSANGAADLPFVFPTSVVGFHDSIASSDATFSLVDGWKMSSATSRYEINTSCGPQNVTIAGITYSNAWACGPDTSGDYQVQLGGGCVNSATSAPVQLNDWSSITCGSPTSPGDGIKTVSCSGTASINSVSTAVTCTNKWAVTNAAYIVQPSGDFNWTELNSAKIASGTACSNVAAFTGSAAKLIAQAQCYANYYWQSGFERESNTCVPQIDMDWSATTAAEFVKVDKIRPNGLVFFEQFKPFSDGSGGTMVTRQEHYDGVKVNGDSWVNCKVIDTGGFTIKKISATKLLATYQSSRVTTSLTKPACLAKFNGLRETFVFYLTK